MSEIAVIFLFAQMESEGIGRIQCVIDNFEACDHVIGQYWDVREYRRTICVPKIPDKAFGFRDIRTRKIAMARKSRTRFFVLHVSIAMRTPTLTRLPRESSHFENPTSATRVQRLVICCQ